ncbi:unnamed protein product [Meganyctiphanes norvegica]|uniref:Uncharacterized protein n=1 Tax=Meganyctiphanes norvegica TaxID=48144 RepID=A0AAV2SW07_MEGNR
MSKLLTSMCEAPLSYPRQYRRLITLTTRPFSCQYHHIQPGQRDPPCHHVDWEPLVITKSRAMEIKPPGTSHLNSALATVQEVPGHHSCRVECHHTAPHQWPMLLH